MEYIKLSFGNALGDEAFTPIWDYLCLVCKSCWRENIVLHMEICKRQLFRAFRKIPQGKR